jgi:hypothetical protein
MGVDTSVEKLRREKGKMILLGSIHGWGRRQMLQENLDSKFEVYSIFKPNSPLAKVVEDVRKLGKDLEKQDGIVNAGGAGNSLAIQ